MTVTQQAVVFGAGVSSLTVNVPLINDDIVEPPTETFMGLLMLAAGVSMDIGEITVSQATVTIMEDDGKLKHYHTHPLLGTSHL